MESFPEIAYMIAGAVSRLRNNDSLNQLASHRQHATQVVLKICSVISRRTFTRSTSVSKWREAM